MMSTTGKGGINSGVREPSHIRESDEKIGDAMTGLIGKLYMHTHTHTHFDILKCFVLL